MSGGLDCVPRLGLRARLWPRARSLDSVGLRVTFALEALNRLTLFRLRPMLSSLLTLGMLASGCGAEDRAKNSESQSQSENANSDAQGGKSDGSKGPEQAPKSKEKSTGDTTQDSSSGPKAIGDSCEADEECASTISVSFRWSILSMVIRSS